MVDLALRTGVDTDENGRADVMDLIGQGRQLPPATLGDDITVGTPVYRDPATGKWLPADASGAATAGVRGITLRTANENDAVTVVVVGILDIYVLDDLDFDDPVYLSDNVGMLADAPGTVEVLIGRVIPGFAQPFGSLPDKLLEVRL